MSSKILLCGVALSFSLLTACGASNDSSEVKGHFENGSVDELNRLNGAQRATAEYETSQGVIISLPLIQEFGKVDMAAAILKSGVANLWITVPSSFYGTINSSVFANLRQAVGTNVSKIKIVRQQKSGTLTVWARDWSPLSAKTASGIRLLDFNYYSSRKADDFTGQSFERLLDFDRLSVPVYNEGGNFMANSLGNCMMTTRVTDANNHAEVAGDYVLNASQVQNLYGASAGCKTTTIFPRMPYEGTGHIDMWAKYLDDKNVIVSELRTEVLNLYSSSSQRAKSATIQKYLNDRAADIKALGYTVTRIPIPGPVWSSSGDTFRSYTNSLLVNKSAIVPRYVQPAYSDLGSANGRYFDSAFQTKYEAEVKSIYEKFGYAFTWITTDDLIAAGGAVHCTTMQIAK